MAQLPKDFLVSGALISPKPGLFWIAGGDWRWSDSPPPSQLAFYVPDFFLSRKKSWAIPSQTFELTADDLYELLLDEVISDDSNKEVTNMTEWIEPDPYEFEKSFQDLQNRFKEGTLKKAVPVVFSRSRCEMSPALLSRFLLNLLRQLSVSAAIQSAGKNLRVYGIWGVPGLNCESELKKTGGILGATPEDLFEITSSGEVLTMALAGTRSKAADPDVESARVALLNDPKERVEHQWVIEDIREALSELGELTLQETEVVELPSLLHLKTRIKLRTTGYSLENSYRELVRRLHPTAALGAFPRMQGWDWLRKQDQAGERGRFGAPLGALWPGKGALCVVAIRNIQWSPQEFRLGSGCGVIQESVLNREWQELSLKRQSIKRLLGL